MSPEVTRVSGTKTRGVHRTEKRRAFIIMSRDKEGVTARSSCSDALFKSANPPRRAFKCPLLCNAS